MNAELIALILLRYGPAIARQWQESWANGGKGPTPELWKAMEDRVNMTPDDFLAASIFNPNNPNKTS